MIYYPSILAHVFNGMLLFISIVIALMYFSKLTKLEPYEKIGLFLLFSIAIGIHGLSHLGLEIIYGYNPLKSISYSY
jgi:hypothetical protein